MKFVAQEFGTELRAEYLTKLKQQASDTTSTGPQLSDSLRTYIFWQTSKEVLKSM